MDVQIESVICYSCRITWWMAITAVDQLRRCQNTFYCPNGHAQHFLGESDAQKLARETARFQLEQNKAATRERRLFTNLRTEQRRTAALRGCLKKAKG